MQHIGEKRIDKMRPNHDDLIYHRVKSSFLTYIRGVSKPGEIPLISVSPSVYVLGLMFFLTLCVVSSCLTFLWFDFWSTPLLLILEIVSHSVIWTMYLCVHQASHDRISKSSWLNKAIANTLTIICLTAPPKRYNPRHGKHHSKLASLEDPDYKFLANWGYVPGKTVEEYWHITYDNLSSPKFYFQLCVGRIRANFNDTSWGRKIVFLAWWILIFSIAIVTGLFIPILSSYIAPVLIGFNVSALLQTITEHSWLSDKNYSELTPCRLLEVDTLSQIIRGFYYRSTIICADLPQHQIHHRNPLDWNWLESAYSEEAQQAKNSALWGIKAHFDNAFISLSKAVDN